MSKKENVPGVECPGDGPRVVWAANVSFFEGELLTLIESLGMKDTQERAVKGIARSMLWQWWNREGCELEAYINRDKTEGVTVHRGR